MKKLVLIMLHVLLVAPFAANAAATRTREQVQVERARILDLYDKTQAAYDANCNQYKYDANCQQYEEFLRYLQVQLMWLDKELMNMNLAN